MPWYFEQKNTFGKWTPRTSAERPDSRSANGGGREIRNVQEVPVELAGSSLGELHRFFNTPPAGQIEDALMGLSATKPEGIDHVLDLLRRLEDPDRMTIGDGLEAASAIRNLLADTILDPAPIITILANQVHADNVAAGWWTDLKTGEDLHGKRNIPEMLMLIVSEIAEGMEGHRKKLMDDKLPHRPMLRVELIDAVIRILDLLGSQDNDIHPAGTIFQEKRAYNAQRADHKPEARLAAGGKAF